MKSIKDLILDEAKNAVPKLQEKAELFRKILRVIIAKQHKFVEGASFEKSLGKLLRYDYKQTELELKFFDFARLISGTVDYEKKEQEKLIILKETYKSLYDEEYIFDEKDLDNTQFQNTCGYYTKN